MGKFQRKPAGAQLSDRKSEEINKSPDIASQIRLLRVAGRKKKNLQAVRGSGMSRGSIKIRAGGFKVGIPNRGRGAHTLLDRWATNQELTTPTHSGSTRLCSFIYRFWFCFRLKPLSLLVPSCVRIHPISPGCIGAAGRGTAGQTRAWLRQPKL